MKFLFRALALTLLLTPCAVQAQEIDFRQYDNLSLAARCTDCGVLYARMAYCSDGLELADRAEEYDLFVRVLATISVALDSQEYRTARAIEFYDASLEITDSCPAFMFLFSEMLGNCDNLLEYIAESKFLEERRIELGVVKQR